MPSLTRFFNLFTLLFLVSTCTNAKDQNTMTLHYKDFGPQVIAHALIGNEWWQWENNGAPDPKTVYDITVIVYRNIDLGVVKKQFPVDAERQKDYRYLEYKQSISYLDKHINESILTELTELLVKTRWEIIHHLPQK